METIYKADIFFFISAISVGVITLFSAIVLWKTLSLISEARRTLRVLRREAARTGALFHVGFGRVLKTWSLARAVTSFITNIKK